MESVPRAYRLTVPLSGWNPRPRLGTSAALQSPGRSRALLGRTLVDIGWLSFWTSPWSELDSNQRARIWGALDPGFQEKEERMGLGLLCWSPWAGPEHVCRRARVSRRWCRVHVRAASGAALPLSEGPRSPVTTLRAEQSPDARRAFQESGTCIEETPQWPNPSQPRKLKYCGGGDRWDESRGGDFWKVPSTCVDNSVENCSLSCCKNTIIKNSCPKRTPVKRHGLPGGLIAGEGRGGAWRLWLPRGQVCSAVV